MFYALLRIVSGLSAAVILIVIESWFNTLSQNANRGRLMALHQVVFYFAMGTGQLMINLVPSDFSATFLIAALLSCCAITPITLVRIENPAVTLNTPVKLSELIRIAPCGIVGAVCAGNAIDTVFNLAPIACLYPVSVAATYAHLSDDKAVASSSALMLAYAIGGVSGPIIASFPMTLFSNKPSSCIYQYIVLSVLLYALLFEKTNFKMPCVPELTP